MASSENMISRKTAFWRHVLEFSCSRCRADGRGSVHVDLAMIRILGVLERGLRFVVVTACDER